VLVHIPSPFGGEGRVRGLFLSCSFCVYLSATGRSASNCFFEFNKKVSKKHIR